jgi:hypothetical protein
MWSESLCLDSASYLTTTRPYSLALADTHLVSEHLAVPSPRSHLVLPGARIQENAPENVGLAQYSATDESLLTFGRGRHEDCCQVEHPRLGLDAASLYGLGSRNRSGGWHDIPARLRTADSSSSIPLVVSGTIGSPHISKDANES